MTTLRSDEMGRPDRLPLGTTLIHIGPQKTGSTALQSALSRSREDLARHGVIYPGPYRKPARAMEAGLGAPMQRGARKPYMHAWRELLGQLDHGPDSLACVSHEGLARFEDDRVQRAVRELGGRQPHVVLVARRYDSYLPSQWQERVKAGRDFPFEEWLRVVLDPERRHSRISRNVWVVHDTPALVERWAAAAGMENVTVIAGNESDRGQLLRAFEGLLGLPDGLLIPDPSHLNRSLSYPETELLRATNQRLERLEVGDREWFHLFANGLIPAIAERQYPAGEARLPRVPSWAHAELEARTAAREEGLRQLGVRVVGDLATLRIGPPDSFPDGVSDVPSTVSIDTAVQAIEGLVLGAARLRQADHHALAAIGKPGNRRSGRLRALLRKALRSR